MSDGIGLAEALLGLDGFRVLEVVETDDRAGGHDRDDRRRVGVLRGVWGAGRGAGSDAGRDPGSGVLRSAGAAGVGQAAVAVPRAGCATRRRGPRRSEHVDAQVVITRRAGVEACRQVGEHARPVSQVADEFGVCWWTIMNAVIEHGTPLVDDPDRVGRGAPARGRRDVVPAPPTGRTRRSTRPGWSISSATCVIDMVEGNSAADLRRWTANADPAWLAGIEVVATDLAESLPGRPVAAPRSRPPGRRPVSCGAGREPLRRQGPPPGAERDARPSGPQARPAVSDPQAAAHRLRTPRRTRPRPDAARPARR